MKSNYKSLGEYIRQVKVRNRDLGLTEPMGINISKFFMPSVANTNGTDLSKYRIVKNGQFAYNPMHVGRDEVLPIALLKGKNKIIVSPAYVVFEIIDEEVLNPEYLMMWFRRKDFDRNAWFTTDNSVRGGFSWESLCEMELPIPSPEKQQEIVNEYNAVVNRIKLNEELNRKLEETAQTLYKHWFVDFEFPISKEYSEAIGKPELAGQPYKSEGGEMVFNEDLGEEVPEGWVLGKLGDLTQQFSGYAFKGHDYSLRKGVDVVRGENVTEGRLRWDTRKKWDREINNRIKNCSLKVYDIVVGMDGSKVGKNWSMISNYDLPLFLAQRVTCLRAKQLEFQSFVYYSFPVLEFSKYVDQVQTGTSVPHISGQQIKDFPLLIPPNELLETYDKLIRKGIDRKFLNIAMNTKLLELKEILLAKLSLEEELVI